MLILLNFQKFLVDLSSVAQKNIKYNENPKFPKSKTYSGLEKLLENSLFSSLDE